MVSLFPIVKGEGCFSHYDVKICACLFSYSYLFYVKHSSQESTDELSYTYNFCWWVLCKQCSRTEMDLAIRVQILNGSYEPPLISPTMG